MAAQIASPTQYATPYKRHSPYAPSYVNTPSRDSDDSCSDDGSLGPQHIVAPIDIKKPAVQAYLQAQAPATQPTVVAVPPTTAKPQRPRLSAAAAVAMLTKAMTFLPLDDIDAARAVGPVFEAAANRVAPKPLGCNAIAFVRWEPQVLRTAIPAPKPKRAAPNAVPGPALFPWRCLACGSISVGPRQCQHCRASLAQSACRVFLGQLRKDLSAELATAMLRSVAPDVTILHIESHTNGADGRGKGCAWAYVNSVEDAMRVTALHKRVFVDLDKDGNEGFWFVQDDALKAHLATFADTLGAHRSRPVLMPRQPLVAELPGKSMLAEFVASSGKF